MGLLLGLALIIVMLAPAAASASLAGYNRASIVKWSPKHNVSSKTRTKVQIWFRSDDTGLTFTAWFWADKKTKYYASSNLSPSDPESSYKRVSRNAFFKKVGDAENPCNCNVSKNVTWKWRKDSHGKRYRYLTRLRATEAIMG